MSNYKTCDRRFSVLHVVVRKNLTLHMTEKPCSALLVLTGVKIDQMQNKEIYSRTFWYYSVVKFPWKTRLDFCLTIRGSLLALRCVIELKSSKLFLLSISVVVFWCFSKPSVHCIFWKARCVQFYYLKIAFGKQNCFPENKFYLGADCLVCHPIF